MAKQNYIKVQDNFYANVNVTAENWNLKPATVRGYCNEKKIPNCFKDDKGKWWIPVDSIKPLSTENIKQILFLTLQLKNNPRIPIDWSVFDFDTNNLRKVYEYLAVEEYIENFDIEQTERLPYDIVLTAKGLNLIFSSKKVSTQSMQETLNICIPLISNIMKLGLIAAEAIKLLG